MTRQLIINADDFGMSAGVNRGIIECSERGILTSASLMVRWPAAAEAAAYNQNSCKISLGLHIDLGEWVLRNGDWGQLYTVVNTDDAQAVDREVSTQLAEFRRLTGQDPSHLDSHQHVHRNEPARTVITRLAKKLRVPLRQCDSGVRYCGDFYGQGAEGEHLPDAISIANLKQILDSLEEGVTELGCHPGYDDGLASAYRAERREEVRVLCDANLPAYLESRNIALTRFDALRSDSQ